MVTEVDAVTEFVFTVNVVLAAPAGTVTLAGTVAALESLERLTGAPPLGASALSVTVPVEGEPPVTLVGLTVTVYSVGVPGAPPLPYPPQE